MPPDLKIKEICEYMKRVTSINKATVQRLADYSSPNLLELAELFEDTANRYLDISDEIRQTIISSGNEN
jgi:hypothetical protein